MAPIASDYTWFQERFPGLAEAYCLTYVPEVPPVELLHRFGARAIGRRRGVDRYYELVYETNSDDEPFVAVTTIGPWSLALEPNGYYGSRPNTALSISHGARLISNFRNVNAANRFLWVEDGQIQLAFEPLAPRSREGRQADAIEDVLRQVGFDLEDQYAELQFEAGFALAEHLTGVRLTADTLASAEYICGIVRHPPLNR